MDHASCGAPVREAEHETTASKRSPRNPRDGGRVGDLAETNGCPLQKIGAVVSRQRAAHARAAPHEAHHLVTSLHKRAYRRAADGSRSAEHHHALWVSR